MQVTNRRIIHNITEHDNDPDDATIIKDIYLTFVPDEVILRYVQFVSDNSDEVSEDSLVSLRCNLLTDNILCTFPTALESVVHDPNNPTYSFYLPPPVIIKINNHFNLSGIPFNGIWEFNMYNSENAKASIKGILSFCLEFVQYAK